MNRVRKILIAGLLAAAAAVSVATPAVSGPLPTCVNTNPANECRLLWVPGPLGIPVLQWFCPKCPGDVE